MANIEERANNSPPPPKRRRVAEDDDDDVPPPPNGSDVKKEDSTATDVKKEPKSEVKDAKDNDDRRSDDIDRAPPFNGAVDVNTRVPRHAKIPARDEYQPAPAPPPPAAPAPMGGYTYAPQSNAPSSNPGAPQSDVRRMASGLTPDVDAVLDRIFQTGLFERKDIDGRALDFLGSVAPNLAMAALEDIQHRDFSTVRNKPAFIMSCFKRVVAAGGSAMPPAQPPPGGYPPTSVPASALAHLPPTVSEALQRVFHSGVCHPSQFDDRAMDILVDLQEPDAVRALSEFAAMEPGRVRNPSAFWMGLARKYKGQGRRDGPPGMPYGGGDGYGTYDRSNTGYGAVDQRIQELISHGQLPPNPLDDRALDALRRLPEQDALSVLEELPEPQRVRNMSAYVMGLCKKFASGEARSLASRGGYGGGPPYGGGGYGPPPYGGGGGGYDAPYGGGYGGGGGGPPPAGGGNGEVDIRRALSNMDVSVRERFYGMVERGMFSENAFDQRAIGALQTMHRDEACAALDELAASDPGRIHNISAYFMGLAKKFARGAV